MRRPQAATTEHAERCAARLGIGLPTTAEELKSAFRRAARANHPDVGGDPNDFRAVKEAHAFLVGCGLRGVFSANGNVAGATADGFSLSDLGLGLESTKNARRCERCGGRGYEIDVRAARRPMYFKCRRCDGAGEVELFNPALPKMRFAGVSQRERKARA